MSASGILHSSQRNFQASIESSWSPSWKAMPTGAGILGCFFDGDGSVTLIQTNGFMRLQVDQNIDSAQVLLRFRRALGGSIVNSQNSSGRHKACLKWSTYGRQAASWLGRIASVKQAQLKIAAAGRVERGDRELVIQKLLELKQHSFEPPAVNCSWQYFAGFFDADGNISVLPALPSISLRVSQKIPSGFHVCCCFCISKVRRVGVCLQVSAVSLWFAQATPLAENLWSCCWKTGSLWKRSRLNLPWPSQQETTSKCVKRCPGSKGTRIATGALMLLAWTGRRRSRDWIRDWEIHQLLYKTKSR